VLLIQGNSYRAASSRDTIGDIFQPVGRLINIGTSNTSVTCDGATSVQDVTVNAIPGLTFQPGPATLLIRFSAPQDPNNLSTVTITETGSRIDLH
jgi:hypothetical protein